MVITDELLYELLSERRTLKEIQPILKRNGIVMSDRVWRRFVRMYNNDYVNQERYIASNNKGYILTTKKNEIQSSAIKNIKLGISLIRNGRTDLKELSDKNQLALLEEDADIYDIAMKLKV